MKSIPIFSLVLILPGALCPATAQVTFTRVLEGDLATDTGYFIGCAWGDYDQDGNVDLFVCSSVSSGSVTNRLYRNNGNGTFTRITRGTPVNERADAGAAVWGDFDSDGDLDLFVSNWASPARDFFYRNEGDGTFTKITQGAWVTDSGAGIGAAWADYDNDGYLDLYVVNSNNQDDFLYHNNHDGTVTRITTGPIYTSGGGSIGCAWADYDGDGDLDLLVANSGPSQSVLQKDVLFRNDGNGVFTRILTGAPVAVGGHSVGVSWGDYDNDGDLDLFVTDVFDNNRLYRNDGPNGFVRITEGAIVNDGGNSVGAAWGDYDNDGYLDLFIARTRADYTAENNLLYHNEGDGTFSKVTTGAVMNDVARSFGCAWADFDNDGDLDLFVANGGSMGLSSPEPGFLYRNDGGANNWIHVRLVGTVSNRSAIGAKVRVKATIKGKTFWQLREISGGSGYCSQNDLRAHFGLGNATNVEVLRIEWPSGIVQELRDVPAQQTLTVTEPIRLQATGRGQFQFKSWKGQAFTIKASADLTVWNAIATVTNLTGTVEFTDPDAGLSEQRFYRVVIP